MSALTAVTAANALLYLTAAIFLAGVTIPLGSMTLGFAQPSPFLSLVDANGFILAWTALLLFWGHPWQLAWTGYAVSLGGTLLGLLFIRIRGIGGPDIWIHFVLLAGLAGGFALLAGARAGGVK